MNNTQYVSPRESAYCPKCGTHPQQIRTRIHGERFCSAGHTFTLKESREAEARDTRLCPDCRGKGNYTGLDITCRRCNGSGMWRPECEPATTPRPPTAADDPDHLNPAKGGNKAADDYW